jgi:16S rRNA (guanine(1405)-N(7))-methyltransferase
MSDEVELVTARVTSSRRYRAVDPGLVRRLAGEEIPRARTREEAVKRVKRRLHQAVGAFARGKARVDAIRAAWDGDLAAPAFRDACVAAMATHASTAERVPHLSTFYPAIWELTGVPASLLDLGCGLGPLALPWMDLPRTAPIHAIDVDGKVLARVEAFLELVGQPHRTEDLDLSVATVDEATDVALLLKLVTTLDRLDPAAATRLIRGLGAAHAVVSFTRQSLGGRSRGMERTYRQRMDRLASDVDAGEVREASVANELVFVMTLSRD